MRDAPLGTVNVTVLDCPGKTSWLAFTNSIRILCGPGRHPGQVDRIDVTRVRPPPRQVVHMYVQMPDPWRCVERALPEHRDDVHVLRPPLDPDDALIQQVGKRGVHDQLGCRLVLDFEVRRGAADLLRARAAAFTSVPVDVWAVSLFSAAAAGAATTPTAAAACMAAAARGYRRECENHHRGTRDDSGSDGNAVGRSFEWLHVVLLGRMKPDEREPIYQTMVSTIPSYRFEAIAHRHRSDNRIRLMDDSAFREHPFARGLDVTIRRRVSRGLRR